jgi:uncharacterized short protein YbdD (DUF466 family)
MKSSAQFKSPGAPWRLGNRIGCVVRSLWMYTREVSGDSAFERYAAHMSQSHPDVPPLSRKEYFKRRTEQKWSGISRCC